MIDILQHLTEQLEHLNLKVPRMPLNLTAQRINYVQLATSTLEVLPNIFSNLIELRFSFFIALALAILLPFSTATPCWLLQAQVHFIRCNSGRFFDLKCISSEFSFEIKFQCNKEVCEVGGECCQIYVLVG